MSKIKYRFNTHSLTFEKVGFSWKKIALKVLSYLAIGTVFTAITVFIAFTYFDSPKEKMQKREIEWMTYQYDILNKKLKEVQSVLGDLEKRDDNIYRMIFEADPIADEIRKAGFGGVDRYKELEGYENSKLIIESTKKLDQVSKQLYIQSKSFDEVIKMAKNKEQMLSPSDARKTRKKVFEHFIFVQNSKKERIAFEIVFLRLLKVYYKSIKTNVNYGLV